MLAKGKTERKGSGPNLGEVSLLPGGRPETQVHNLHKLHKVPHNFKRRGRFVLQNNVPNEEEPECQSWKMKEVHYSPGDYRSCLADLPFGTVGAIFLPLPTVRVLIPALEQMAAENRV